MKLYEVCIEQEYSEATTVAIALSEKNAYKEAEKWQKDYGEQVFVFETETID